jgi:hypothetical protein
MAGLGGFWGYALGGINWDATPIGTTKASPPLFRCNSILDRVAAWGPRTSSLHPDHAHLHSVRRLHHHQFQRDAARLDRTQQYS